MPACGPLGSFRCEDYAVTPLRLPKNLRSYLLPGVMLASGAGTLAAGFLPWDSFRELAGLVVVLLALPLAVLALWLGNGMP